MKRLTLSLILMGVVGLVPVQAQAPGKWLKLAPFPEPAEEVYGIAAGGKLYVLGGLAPGWKPRGLVFEYDSATNTWTKKKPMSLDRIYIAGGEFQDDRFMAAFWALEAYHPATNTGSTLPRMPIPRHGLAGAVIGNRLHLVTGEIQAAGIQGAHLASESHDAFEFADR